MDEMEELDKLDELGGKPTLKQREETVTSEIREVLVKRSYGGCFLSFFVGMSILLFSGFAGFYYFVAKPMAATGQDMTVELAEALSGVFGTNVEVVGSTVVLEKSEIEELAVVQRKIQVITKYETSWMGSENLMIVRGDFLVKAGFDLSGGGEWSFVDGRMDGPLPEGKVLSVEPIGSLEVYYSENGIINHLSTEDQASAFNYLIRQARRDAERSDIGREAEDVLIRRVNDRLGAPPARRIDWQRLP